MNYLALAGCALLASSAIVRAQISTELTASGLNQPIFAGTPTGDGRLFVLERGGAVRVIDAGGNLLGTPFVSGTGQTVNTDGEGGVLGLAFHPGFLDTASPGYGQLFLNYTASNGATPGPFDTVIEQITVSDPTSNAPTVTGRETVLQFSQPQSNHNGGWIGFSPNDGANLYIATGDGGGSNDPGNNAQDTSTLLGNILRINVDGDDFTGDAARNYSIPATNVFAGSATEAGEIFAYGLRNPFRNSFDRATGDLYIGDVGQNAREEINFIPGTSDGGQNFGWRLREGDIATPTGGVGGPAPVGAVDPIYDYAHADLPANRGSVTGGYVYRGSLLPDEYDGQYFFGDFVNGTVYVLDPSNPDATVTDVTSILLPGINLENRLSSFGEDTNGELYIVDIGGNVYQIIPEPATMGLFGLGGLFLRRHKR